MEQPSYILSLAFIKLLLMFYIVIEAFAQSNPQVEEDCCEYPLNEV